ncbi:uncharacterized protein LOC111109355 [Crassostrea virginica]
MASVDQTMTACKILDGSQSFLGLLRTYFEYFVEFSSLEVLVKSRGPYVVKTEIILQTAERKLLEKDHEVYFKTGRRESIRKYLEDMKKILIVSYVATVAVSKSEFTEKEAKLVDKMWKKTTENVAKLDIKAQLDEVLGNTDEVKYNILRLQKRIEKKNRSGKEGENFIFKKKKPHLVRFVRFVAKNLRLLD